MRYDNYPLSIGKGGVFFGKNSVMSLLVPGSCNIHSHIFQTVCFAASGQLLFGISGTSETPAGSVIKMVPADRKMERIYMLMLRNSREAKFMYVSLVCYQKIKI